MGTLFANGLLLAVCLVLQRLELLLEGLGLFLFGGLVVLFARLRKHGKDLVEQVADAVAVLGRDRQDLLEAESPEVLCAGLLLDVIDLVDREKDGFAASDEEAGELHVGRCELGAPVHDHHDGVGFFERDLGLAEDLAGNQGLVVGNDTARVDDARVASLPLDLAVDAVARDAWLVADDRST